MTTALAESNGSAAIDKEAALAFIRAVNLQAGDLPGFFPFTGEGPPREASSPEEEEIEGIQESGALRCARHGKRRARAIEAEGSLLADHSEEGVGSIVVVLPSEALAEAEIAALASGAGRRCLAHGLRRAGTGGAGPHSPAYAIKTTVVPVADTLGREAVDIHVLARLRRARFRRHRVGRRRGFPPPAKLVYSTGTIFRVGAADIVFLSLSTRRRFPDAAIEQRLLGLLYNRAEAHRL